MLTALKHLKKKIILLSFAISCAIILIMLMILYVLMSVTYDSRTGTAAELISQAAVQSMQEIRTEQFLCSELETDDAGDYIILRNPLDVESVSLHGTITCSRSNAYWYSTGGGIIVSAMTKTGEPVYFYQEYSFNKDVSEITVDFPNPDRFKPASHSYALEDTEVAQDMFVISKPWWASSNEQDDSADDAVKLELEHITIKYKENFSLLNHAGNPVTRSFYEIFNGSTPEILTSFRSFFLLTDKEGDLIEIGSMDSQVSEEEALTLLSQNPAKAGHRINGISYSYKCFETDNAVVHVYLSSLEKPRFMRQLGFLSALLGSITAILLFFIISYASEKMVRQLSVSYEKQNQFIANASHELKTPITVISATADILAAKNGRDKWLETIKAQSDKMQRLLHEMLELTKLNESIETKIPLKSFDLSEVAENTILYFESRAYEERRHLLAEIEPDICLTGQEEKLEELIGILLDNAIKYADDEASVTMRLWSDKNSVILTCSNPCREFDAANADRLFERFYRSDESHSDEKEGFGLGLSIAQLIVMQHKGTLKVTYENKTVTFTAVFPVK